MMLENRMYVQYGKLAWDWPQDGEECKAEDEARRRRNIAGSKDEQSIPATY